MRQAIPSLTPETIRELERLCAEKLAEYNRAAATATRAEKAFWGGYSFTEGKPTKTPGLWHSLKPSGKALAAYNESSAARRSS